MNESLFIQWVAKWFGPIARKVVEKVNNVTNGEPVYLFKTMLRKEFSPTLKWGSLSSNNIMVSADVVAMDSALPLKKRDAIRKAEGDIPKLGMKLHLNERTMTDLDILQRTNGQDNAIIQKLFGDTKKSIYGIYEVLEYMFLQALSTGVTLIQDENNVGTGIRIDFRHPAANKYGVSKLWSDASATPVDDIEHVISEASANGDTIALLLMDRATFNALRNNAQTKQFYGNSLGMQGTTGFPTPNLAQLNDAIGGSYPGVSIQIVDRTITFEKNGVRTKLKPFAENTVVFLTDPIVGTLTYGQLAEMSHPAKQVTYETVDDMILLSKYHKVDPLQEFTSSQALALPVIDNVDSIYIMDTTDASTDEQTEGDATFTYNGTDYTKASVVAGLNATGEVPTSTTSQTDATLQGKINKLSEAGIAIFEENIVEAA